jgi:hypothetical protein
MNTLDNMSLKGINIRTFGFNQKKDKKVEKTLKNKDQKEVELKS